MSSSGSSQHLGGLPNISGERNGLCDISSSLHLLADITRSTPSFMAPISVKDALKTVLDYLRTSPSNSVLQQTPPNNTQQAESIQSPVDKDIVLSKSYNIPINKRTELSILYSYTPEALVEFPETSADGHVGHLFNMDPNSWYNPSANFVYSLGSPRGQSKKGTDVYCSILVDEQGVKVPCREAHATCQGCKVCPFSDRSLVQAPHCHASRLDLQSRLEVEREMQLAESSPLRDVFEKTFALWSALCKQGCGAAPNEQTFYSVEESLERNSWHLQQENARRGHEPNPTCNGRLVFQYDSTGRALVRCEHYDSYRSRGHLCTYEVGNGLYNTEYMEALFSGDLDKISAIETDAIVVGFDPLTTSCPSVSNVSSIRVNCSREHRNANGSLAHAEMERLECKSKFRLFEPLEEYRQACPRILVVCHKEHRHPIPLPTKTPPTIRSGILSLLERLDIDLADLTARRFLRHPATRAYLQEQLPHIREPTLANLHPSLANRDHVRAYILQVQAAHFPHGTGWEGVVHLKEVQDKTMPHDEHYVRYVAELPASSMETHDEDDPEDTRSTAPIRFVICMTKEASARLLQAQYLQSDISFKRIVGFKEFELVAFDRHTRTTIIYCRILLTRQTAAAHQHVFQKIEEIVLQDTGKPLRWRHLHAQHVDDLDFGILHYAADQHGGQAKGLGLHLKALAQMLPGRYDLHEPHRLLSSLDEYEHLRRVFRICSNHIYRNIKSTKVMDAVKNKMRSLVCVEHDDWDGTIQTIELEGGKVGSDWVYDKLRSKFAFEGMCWSKSYIPKVVWQAGDSTTNVGEALHADVYQEGTLFTLLGGIKKGWYYDTFKLQTLITLEKTGVRPTYRRGHISESYLKNLRRRTNKHQKIYKAEDIKITRQNQKLWIAQRSRDRTKLNLLHVQSLPDSHPFPNGTTKADALDRAIHARDKAVVVFQKALASSLELVGKGTGLVGILLPQDAAAQWLQRGVKQ